jgi:hypothetical protein
VPDGETVMMPLTAAEIAVMLEALNDMLVEINEE